MMNPMLLTSLVFASLGCVDTATVNEQDGGYEHVLVAIGKDVAYHGDILVNLKALFRKASAFLLAATKGKFYFKEVIISVPSSWPPMGRKKVWEDLFNQADVQVVSGLKEPDTLNPSRSFPGDFNPVRFPSEFVRDLNSTTTKKFGKPEYHLIHHWANHRYGVFAEHASSPDKALYCSNNKVSQFCDQDTHNPDAPNLQNERHQGVSTWDVISKHDDFLR
ncbi:calcium-activated chloride channel regulator 2-like [Ixodes scapularis]|uniref:calcium-activated chloride channel regulator 2-like n=1 Tax=Ixodes scapularis TaxID=6945 RepID=UPI001C3811C5|nr:calcium-activated chloride channel regulator 2-like [Ixodes scapularis]